MVRVFQEKEKPQSYSPTVSKKSIELLMALAANNSFEFGSVDIRSAFLQAKTLYREYFVKTPEDQRKEG